MEKSDQLIYNTLCSFWENVYDVVKDIQGYSLPKEERKLYTMEIYMIMLWIMTNILQEYF